jgi:hypothetical protein
VDVEMRRTREEKNYEELRRMSGQEKRRTKKK